MQTNQRTSRLKRLAGLRPVILPSLLQCDFGNLKSEVDRLQAAGVEAFHLDVMDGHFVPNFTYGMPIVSAVRRLSPLFLDVHLMMDNPGSYLDQFAQAGADCITIHAEISEDISELISRIHQMELAAGLAINPQTDLESVQPYLADCDLLLIMGVNAGFGGQAFNPVALEKLERAKQHFPNLLLEVDGGVNKSTIGDCVAAGAELLVVGSAIFEHDDYHCALRSLSEAMER
jgi:ribulose-phosphate 3-epimerase